MRYPHVLLNRLGPMASGKQGHGLSLARGQSKTIGQLRNGLLKGCGKAHTRSLAWAIDLIDRLVERERIGHDKVYNNDDHNE